MAKRRRAAAIPVSGKQPKRIASLDPVQFAPEFDVIHEVGENRDDYLGTEGLTLYGFPSYLRTSLDRIRARVIAVQKPGLGIVVSCCVGHGVGVLREHKDVVHLIKLKEKFDLADEVHDAEHYDEVANWVRSFMISIPDPSGGGTRKLNVSMPEDVKIGLTNFAGEVGAPACHLGVVAMMVTLSNQPTVLPEHRKYISNAVVTFLRRVKRRAKVAQALMEPLT